MQPVCILPLMLTAALLLLPSARAVDGVIDPEDPDPATTITIESSTDSELSGDDLDADEDDVSEFGRAAGVGHSPSCTLSLRRPSSTLGSPRSSPPWRYRCPSGSRRHPSADPSRSEDSPWGLMQKIIFHLLMWLSNLHLSLLLHNTLPVVWVS